MTITIEAQITINSSKTAVWTIITYLRHAAKIIIGIKKIEILKEIIRRVLIS